MRSGMKTLTGWLRSKRTTLLTLAGFGGLSSAAWTWLGLSAGLAAIGISFLAIEALGEPGGRP